MKKVLLQAFVVFFFIIGNASAQTLHVINFCNTLDPNIGCEIDYPRTKQEAGLIAAYLNYGIKYYDGVGQNCSKENLMNVLNSLKCNKDDIILFYYSGHGTRSSQDTSEFPQMCLKYDYDESKFVAVHTVIEKLQAKGARFTLVMTDCCNNAIPGVSAKSLMSKNGGPIVYDEAVARNYRKLFLEKKGIVAVTSSKKGQTSGGGKTHGGLFSYAFFEIGLYAACTGVVPATWENVLGMVTTALQGHQEPYYEIKLKQVSTTPSSTPAPAPAPTPVIAAEPTFASDLATLLDGSHSEEWLNERVNYLANKYFTSDSKVITVGRNGSSILEHESARLFLRRIASSGKISKINIINEKTDSSGKHSYIKVQEIRKPKS